MLEYKRICHRKIKLNLCHVCLPCKPTENFPRKILFREKDKEKLLAMLSPDRRDVQRRLARVEVSENPLRMRCNL